MLCLDEPTAGVAQRETEAFGPLIMEIRRELGAAMLVIEHDMPLIMSISDRVYCLEIGRVIAEGDPVTVRNDPKVIASYLGIDERAIARSGAIPTAAAATDGRPRDEDDDDDDDRPEDPLRGSGAGDGRPTSCSVTWPNDCATPERSPRAASSCSTCRR